MMFFNETISWAQVVGIILMLVSFVIAADNGKGQKRANLKWLLLCLAAFASQGGIGLMQKIHQSSAHKGELNSFLIIAFIVSAIASASVSACLYGKERGAGGGFLAKRDNKTRFAVLMIAVMVLAGACMASNHKLNLYLSGVMDSAVFFPIVNGGGLVLTTLASLLVFRERLSAKRWIGVAVGILSVVFPCNPFG
jgi:drug/metabolite transporter (DMT)-like permease